MVGEVGLPRVSRPSPRARRGTPASGAFASTTTCLPPGSRTTTSGRRRVPVGAADGGLLDEVAVREHAGHLDDPAQLHLAPAAAHDRRAERGDEVPGLVAQLLLAVGRAAAPAPSARGRRPGARPRAPASLPSTFWSDSLIGATRCSTACFRWSRSCVVFCWSCSSCDFASARNDWLFVASASAASAFIVLPERLARVGEDGDLLVGGSALPFDRDRRPGAGAQDEPGAPAAPTKESGRRGTRGLTIAADEPGVHDGSPDGTGRGQVPLRARSRGAAVSIARLDLLEVGAAPASRRASASCRSCRRRRSACRARCRRWRAAATSLASVFTVADFRSAGAAAR